MAAQPKLYLIPGMGADARLFEGLRREGLEFEVLEFIPPVKGESLREYALRMGERIDTTKPYVLGGQSLGGTMATEIAQRAESRKADFDL
jgi:surfactin synthase thioesterase subunit